MKHFLFLLLCALAGVAATAQTNVEIFGQNRVQYRKFDWRFFDTEHFRIYHYDRNGPVLARYVAEQAESDIKVVEQKLGGRFPKRFSIILYNNYDEYRQTNVGRRFEDQLRDVPAGRVGVVGNELVVYFDGVHTNLRRQLRSGMSRVVMQRMLFGEGVRQVIKNAIRQDLPDWTSAGYIAYLVDGWDAKAEGEWRGLMEARPRDNFFTLSNDYPELAGKAFWRWVSERFGEQAIQHTLYTMQQKSNLNQGIREALKMKAHKAYDTVMQFYRTTFAQDAAMRDTIAQQPIIRIRIPKDGGVVRSVRVSPTGRNVAYVSWKDGQYTVYIQRTDNEQQRSVILTSGRQDFNEVAPDPDYPILAWSNNGYKLAILYRKGPLAKLRIYDALKAKIQNYNIPPNRFDRVLGMSFNEDNDQIIFSAIRKSQTDLYGFTLRGSRMTNITNDVWDDTQPFFVSGGARRGILFLSNRPAPGMDVPAQVNELPTGPMNLFFYDTKTQSRVLLQGSNVTHSRITQPIQYGPDNFAYLCDSNGVQNKFAVIFGRTAVGNLDSAISIPITNYSRSILYHQWNPLAQSVADVVQEGDEYAVYFYKFRPPSDSNSKQLQPTTLLNIATRADDAMPAGAGSNATPTRPVLLEDGDVYNSSFGADTTATVQQPSNNRPTTVQQSSNAKQDTSLLDVTTHDSTYLKLKSRPYRLSFKPDFFSIQLNNTVLFNRYQSAAFNSGGFTNPPLGGMLSASLNDALENHRFTGGIRLPVSFSGMTYFLQYENFTRRADWSLLFLRTTQKQAYEVTFTDSSGRPVFSQENIGKVSTNMLQGSWSYPFDRIRSVRAHLGLRQDVLDFKAQDTISLAFLPRSSQYWAMSRVEWVFDNSSPLAFNIRQGFRYKFFAEYILPMTKETGSGCYNAGLDFRWYKRLYKNSIFAVRLAGAHSGGKGGIRYQLGGVDNWIRPRQSPYSGLGGGNAEFGFQALATNLRGYDQNARTGNTYAVTNMEVRIPVFSTFFKRPIQSNFLRSLQLVGFADAGSAWNGLLPDAESLTQQVTLFNPPNPVIAQVEIPGASGLALGYGAGLRASLLGYFVRVDAAWNIEGVRKPLWYFSFGTDF